MSQQPNFLRSAFTALVLLAAALPPAFATDYDIEVGGTTITLPVEDGYVPVSPTSQQLHQFAQAALPPELRLVETFHTPDNLAAIGRGENADGHYLMVQVMRQVEPMDLGDADWQAMLPGITAGMASVDLNESEADSAARDARMSAAAGADVAMRFGQMERPTIYMTTADGVRFVVRIPVTVDTPNGREQIDVGAAGAIVRVKSKALFLYWYAMPGNSASIAVAQRKLDATIDAMLAANGTTPAAVVADAGDGDAARDNAEVLDEMGAAAELREYGLLGGLVCIGLVVLVIGAIVAIVLVVRKRKRNP